MILNAPIILSIFLAAIGLLPGLAAGVMLVRGALPGAGDRDGQGAYLVFLLLLTAFGIRVLAWPLSYLALSSAVPHVSGAMCIFGVTRLSPLWANLLQATRPILVLVLGGWLTLRLVWSAIDRLTPGPAHRRSWFERLLLPLSVALLLADCLFELVVMLSLRPDHPVYCCGSVYDLPGRLSTMIPQHLFGVQHAHLLLPLLVAVGLVTSGAALLAGHGARREWPVFIQGRRWSRSAALFLGTLLPLLAFTAFLAGMEVLAPRLTGLPYHHCLYCLLGKTTYGPWLAVTLAAGILFTAWGGLLLPGGHRSVLRPAGRLLTIGGIFILLFLGVTAAGWQQVGQGGDLGHCPSCGQQMYDTVFLVEVVSGTSPAAGFCSTACALRYVEDSGGRDRGLFVTVRDEFTGTRLDSGAAFFVEVQEDIPGLPEGNRWHQYQYLENAHIMAFELGGNIVPDPFAAVSDECRP